MVTCKQTRNHKSSFMISICSSQCNYSMSARRVAWDLAESVYKLKNMDKVKFYSPIEARAMPAPTSKSPKEREFVVDSGASMHMLGTKDMSSDEMETLRRSGILTTVVTVNGKVQTSEEPQVYIHDLDLFLTVQSLEDTLAGLSLGKLC